MKKKLLIVALLIIFSVPFFAFSASMGPKEYAEINTIKNALANQDSAMKLLLVKQYEKSTTLPFIVNLFAGCGIGSYIQGDVTGGTIGLLGELASVGMIVFGATGSGERNYMTIIGTAALAGFRIFELIRPFDYANSFNFNLKNAVFGSASVSASLLPTLTHDNEVGVTFAARISF